MASKKQRNRRQSSRIEADVAKRFEFAAPASIEAAKAEGKLPTFEIHGYTGKPMRLAGYRHPVIVELAGIKAAGTIPILRGHDDDRIVGHGDAEVDDSGIHASGTISGTGPDAQEIVANAKNGFRWKASIGAEPIAGTVEHLRAGKSANVNGHTIQGPHTIVRGANLTEISLLARAADSSTSAAIAASITGVKEMDDFQTWLDEKGIEAEAVTDATRPILQAQYEAENKKAPPPTVEAAATASDIQAAVDTAVKSAVADTIATITAKQEHDAAIARITAGHPELAAKAVAEKWSTDKAELEVERASRPKPITASTGVDGAPDGAQVIEAALCLNSGMASDEMEKTGYEEKVINAATAGKYRGYGFHALFYDVIQAAGMYVKPGIANNDLIRTAFKASNALEASGVSNYTLTNLLSNTSNKYIVAGFNGVEQAWREISAIGSVSDFKTRTGVRLTGDFTYEQISPAGELQHAKMAEATYTNQAKTYGKIFGIDRQTLINDDLGELDQTARFRIGRGAGLKINDVFWTEFFENAGNFFAAGNNNYQEGAATNLQESSLTAAELLFYDQTDEDGDPVNLMPEILLVPNALVVTASNLMNSLEVRDTTANTVRMTSNPHAGKFSVVRSSYMGHADYGNSILHWWLLANPNTMGIGVIETVFLNGRQEPTVESSDLDFDQLGIQMRGYHDFGVSKMEPRAGVKTKGEA